MNEGMINKAFICYVTLSVAFLGFGFLSYYYPNHTEEITVGRVVVGEGRYGLVTTGGEYYNINFETYAMVVPGVSYRGTVTKPWLSHQYIDHVERVDTQSEVEK